MKKVRIIAGATASGKTKAAILWAKQIGGCVVNADSLQIYQDIPLLTARPCVSEQEGIPHFLYGLLGCHEACSVMRWIQLVVPLLKEVAHPIVVGGTGLYLNALMNGLTQMPDVDEEIRKHVREMPIEQVRSLVQECRATDPQRLRRALEVQLSTGRPLSWFQSQAPKKYIEAEFDCVWIHPPRDVLYNRCNNRFQKMIDQGALEEVQQLNMLHPTGGVTQAIGYKELTRHLAGEFSLEEAIAEAQLNTRHYAKRQTTWFKHQLKTDKIIHNPLDIMEK